jgi:hypothetical protein
MFCPDPRTIYMPLTKILHSLPDLVDGMLHSSYGELM